VSNNDDVVIWSLEHQRWWRPGEMGYCDTLAEAGRYPRARAELIVSRANIVEFHECAIPVTALLSTALSVTASTSTTLSITCPFCGITSYHPKDVAAKYCGLCHRFHEDLGVR